MIRPIVKDIFFLGRKSEDATKQDLSVGQDLQDTLTVNRDRCVGMAANMIGVKKKIIIVNIGFMNVVMYNPVIIRKGTPYETEEGCLSLDGVRKTTRYQNIEVEYLDSNWKNLSSLDNSMAKMIMETINNMLIELYATMAQAEIEKKEKRQAEGISAKKARGDWDDYGRPKVQKPSNWDEVISSWKRGEITAVKAMKLTNIKKTTFYKLLKQYS